MFLIVIVMLFAFAKYESSSPEYTLINGRLDSASGDLNVVSYIYDGATNKVPPSKNDGYILTDLTCTNADAVWDNSEWSFKLLNMSGKVLCNLEFELASSINITMYGAPGAVIEYVDANGSHSQTLDNTGKKENVTVSIMPNVVFTDTTIAKDPNNLSNDFSKTINIADSTTDVYVMPDGDILYWYGYNNGLEIANSTNGWASGNSDYSISAATFNTNDVYLRGAGGKVTAVGTTSAISKNTTRIHIISMSTNVPTYGVQVLYDGTKRQVAKSGNMFGQSNANVVEHNTEDINLNSYYVYARVMNVRTGYLYALWYE